MAGPVHGYQRAIPSEVTALEIRHWITLLFVVEGVLQYEGEIDPC